MPTTQFPRVPSAPSSPNLQALGQYVSQLANLLASFSKEMDYLLNGSIDANNIRANSITAKLIQAGAITADKIEAGAVTADKIDVDELSAISANLGTITAGLIESVQIFGSYIATANGTYPRSEMSIADNWFAVYKDADNSLVVSPNFNGVPGLFINVNGNTAVGLSANETSVTFTSEALPLFFGTNISGDISIFPAVGYNLIFRGWDSVLNNGTGNSLQGDLDDKADKSAINGTFYVATTPGGAANHAITVTNGVITS